MGLIFIFDHVFTPLSGALFNWCGGAFFNEYIQPCANGKTAFLNDLVEI